jgi:hypothetical protein
MEHVQSHLSSIGIVVEEDEDLEMDPKVGFRKIPKRE